jgi:hypothetical protein
MTSLSVGDKRAAFDSSSYLSTWRAQLLALLEKSFMVLLARWQVTLLMVALPAAAIFAMTALSNSASRRPSRSAPAPAARHGRRGLRARGRCSASRCA